MTDEPIRLYYTFGNHQHWVDFHWLWGPFVLPSAIDDMVKFCDATGAKGCVNFDGVGYERMASESPEAAQRLRELVQSGRMEVVGGSYAQPYGLFYGGESNVRHRVYGVRTIRKILGVPVNTFWEEEFDFFPQLPQILAGVGIKQASLYFQWTWHTPEVPRETVPVAWWEGLDGTRLLCATRNRLNLHQWPEDFQILLDELAEFGPREVLARANPDSVEDDGDAPALVLQWLELMPSPDWMCRSELMIPKMKQLSDDPRFHVVHVTLDEYLEEVRQNARTASLPVRNYSMHEVWHGMSLGKNGDRMRRLGRKCEHELLMAESLHATLGLFGRPYAQWDVYPTWEIEEGWRQTMIGQHHDNDECEGLCGYVGAVGYETALSHAANVQDRGFEALAKRVAIPEGETLVYNPLGWARDVAEEGGEGRVVEQVPAFGYKPVAGGRSGPHCTWVIEEGVAAGELGGTSVRIDARTGEILQITSACAPEGVVPPGRRLFTMSMSVASRPWDLARWARQSSRESLIEDDHLLLMFSDGTTDVRFEIGIDAASGAVTYEFDVFDLPRPDGGMAASLQAEVPLAIPDREFWADQPYSVQAIEPTPHGLKKYPSGDWMTSPQWFEEVENSLVSYSLLDFRGPSGGFAVLHDGSQQWFARGDAAKVVLTMYDPWDEDRFVPDVSARFAFLPHAGFRPVELWRAAQEFQRPPVFFESLPGEKDLPESFAGPTVDTESVCVTAFHRELEHEGSRIENYAGVGIGYPYVLRLVEFDGRDCECVLSVPGTVASAYKTNLLGQIGEKVSFEHSPSAYRSSARVRLRPFEIATFVLDVEEGRKQFRDLDAHRNIWSTIHRVEEPS